MTQSIQVALKIVAVGVGVLCLQGGCAQLPDAKRDIATTPTGSVTFEGARGRPVSEAHSEAIIENLENAGGATDVLQKHLAYSQEINPKSPLTLGNKLTLLQNGPATYQSMFAAIREAKDHINLETYIFSDDEVGQQFADLLLEKQAAGVQVNLIYDSVGGLTTPAEFFDRLKEGGIQVLEFNPVNPLELNQADWEINSRDHRKQLLVDGRIAFIGGINISDTYSSSPSSSRSRAKRARTREQQKTDPTKGWRDTHVRIEGPVVADFQKLFIETWTKQNGEPLAPKNYFPKLTAKGDGIVSALGSTPDDEQNPIYLTLMSVISHAERSVHLTIAYFVPDEQLRKALTEAAQRGVEVKLILPGISDAWAVFHLGRSYYDELLRGGVKIYERRGAVMHAKTASVDGVWSTIGSTNMDWRSFLHNDEINAVIVGRDFAAQMDSMFAQDLKESDEIALENWRRRSWLLRMQEQLARVGAYWL